MNATATSVLRQSVFPESLCWRRRFARPHTTITAPTGMMISAIVAT